MLIQDIIGIISGIYSAGHKYLVDSVPHLKVS